ncbi:MAG: glycoside hydrolase family 1 protein [Anaerolineales bacterium]|nr:glycoside hydrolase family 1 protein [Anaerolineales bacterium]
MAEATMMFPQDFLWGTATSSHQVEGSNTNNDWWVFEKQPGKILDGNKSGLACDWWQNAEADLDLAAEMGTNAHRLSLEWSRIEPEPSVFDMAAIERYRQILQAMRERGIEPMVTLHHFSNPLWLVEKGDFNNDIIVEYFQRYTAKVVDTLGDLIPKWITINEPMVYVFMRYLDNVFPPASRNGFGAGLQAVRHMLHCHAAAYHTIKDKYPAAQVGAAKQLALFDTRPEDGFFQKWWARRISWLFNDVWLRAMHNGRFPRLLGGGKIKNLAGTYDYMGINYYTRHYLNFSLRGDLLANDWGAGAVVSDGNYGEVYPYGLYRVIKHILPYNKPIYITENGLPDAADKLRPGFILDHLRQIWHAISFCFPVMGYYHWSLIDNFEWDRGWTQRFGLIEVDPETQTRTLRNSGRLYQEICQSYSISSDMTARYAPDLLPVMFPGERPLPFAAPGNAR